LSLPKTGILRAGGGVVSPAPTSSFNPNIIS
jgi:hypothetical protein